MKKYLALIFLLIMLITGCSSNTDIRSTVYHASESQKILKQVMSDNSLTEDEQNVFKDIVNSSNQKVFDGKTVGELIDAGMKLKAQIEKDKETMNNTLSVSVIDKLSLDANKEVGRIYPQIQLDINVANKSNNDISAFKGIFTVINKHGDICFTAEYTDTEPLMEGVSRTDTIVTDVNDTNPLEIIAYKASLEDLKITWEPTAIIFMDGTKIGEDQNDRSFPQNR